MKGERGREREKEIERQVKGSGEKKVREIREKDNHHHMNPADPSSPGSSWRWGFQTCSFESTTFTQYKSRYPWGTGAVPTTWADVCIRTCLLPHSLPLCKFFVRIGYPDLPHQVRNQHLAGFAIYTCLELSQWEFFVWQFVL